MIRLSLRRRLLYISVIYLTFIALLAVVEIGARFTLPHVSSLDLLVATSRQKSQVANAQQSGIFEGDPLFLWRLKPNLDDVVWDFTVVSTNAQNLRADHAIKAKASGAIRIVCLGDSVTFGYRVPPVWPERPTDYDRDWLSYPILLEKNLRAANPARAVEVIAMAVPGYTSHQGLAWLRRDINGLEPNLLIVYLDNMNEIVRLAREQGAAVIVIAAPYRDSVTNPPEAELMVHYRKLLRAEMEQKRIPFLEVTELTEAAYPSNQGWFDELIHPNHMGHRLMAAELLELLSAGSLPAGLAVPTLTP